MHLILMLSRWVIVIVVLSRSSSATILEIYEPDVCINVIFDLYMQHMS
jgi:hypothetical protein